MKSNQSGNVIQRRQSTTAPWAGASKITTANLLPPTPSPPHPPPTSSSPSPSPPASPPPPSAPPTSSSMLRSLLLSSSSSSDDSAATSSRDSLSSSDSSSASASAADLLSDSSRPSVDELRSPAPAGGALSLNLHQRKPSKHFSLPKFASVFRRETTKTTPPPPAAKRASAGAKDVIHRYLKKVKPLLERLSGKQQQPQQPKMSPGPVNGAVCLKKDSDPELTAAVGPNHPIGKNLDIGFCSESFSSSTRFAGRRRCISSCPSSIMSSPRRGDSGFGFGYMDRAGSGLNASSMEELQSAIQGAIAHCKNSMLNTDDNNKTTVISHEI
ncbi:ROP-interactive CRIB motif-containing protein 3 [Striga asiatica]|uniref:ROP-interactive CRIB motif-containing protein 3 n=1 Tax=Striga asiatica TaxID=4170 RepID=A0A5A7Q325_STRAF|nr:ROP-interactive CRIB motif-containing protein 3 [Striga asiatica]